MTRPPRRIAVVTVGRSDYGIFRPLLESLRDDPRFELQLIVGGAHFVPRFGSTIGEIERDGFPIAARVDLSLGSDGPGSLSRAMGLGCIGFASAYETLQPDLLVLLGDRYEMLAAAVAASPFLIPIVHHAGGSVTEGAIDDSYRHCISKLATYHFAETNEHARRIRQMGERDEAVIVTGALGLDGIRRSPRLSRDELARRFAIRFDGTAAPALITYHPVTRDYTGAEDQMRAVIEAVTAAGLSAVYTYPNADTNSDALIRILVRHAAEREDVFLVPHFGAVGYYSMMNEASMMIGNSSSGIIEAASFGLPVVDIGDRQKGRAAGANVLHCGYGVEEIAATIEMARSKTFAATISGLVNPYGDGHATERMLTALASLPIGRQVAFKPFVDRSFEPPDTSRA